MPKKRNAKRASRKRHPPPSDDFDLDAFLDDLFLLGRLPTITPLDQLPDPRQYQTEIPELLACPLTRDEHRKVLECMRAVDPIFARGVSVRMRMEFASAMLASACAIAYASAEAQGQSDGPFRFASAENLIIRRAKELYAQGRA